jgi:hypothetical protein
MTHLSRKQIAEIEGKIYLISQMPREKRSEKFSEIITDIKHLIATFEKDRKRHSARVKRCLTVLLGCLDSSHVNIVSVEDREVWMWVINEARTIVSTWDD